MKKSAAVESNYFFVQEKIWIEMRCVMTFSMNLSLFLYTSLSLSLCLSGRWESANSWTELEKLEKDRKKNERYKKGEKDKDRKRQKNNIDQLLCAMPQNFIALVTVALYAKILGSNLIFD